MYKFRVMTEEDSSSSEARHQRSVFEQSCDAILFVEKDGRLLDANSRACEMLSSSREILLGRSLADLFREEDAPEATAALEQSIDTGSASFIAVLRCSDGVVIKVDTSVRYIPEESIIHTSFKELGEPTCAGPAVQPAQNLPEATDRAQTAIWADMSHDLRTPLNGIIGLSQLLERQDFGPLTERQRTFVEGIQTCGWQLINLVNDIVDLSRIEGGTFSLSREWIALAPVVESAQTVTRSLADKKRITLRVSSHSELPELFADPSRMTRILCSLLSNAVTCTPEGGSVSLTSYADETSICVCGTGVGIGGKAEPLPQLPRESEPLRSYAGERPNGSGLSLTLARRLVEMHGGTLDARSAMGRGSAFRVTIPRNRQLQAVVPQPQAVMIRLRKA